MSPRRTDLTLEACQLRCASQCRAVLSRFPHPSIRALKLARLGSHEESRRVGAPSTRWLSDGGPGNIARSPTASNLREIAQGTDGESVKPARPASEGRAVDGAEGARTSAAE